MFAKTLGSVMAFGVGAVTILSAFDTEAACCHRHRRAACCDPCVTRCCDPCGGTVISYVAPAAPACCTAVVEEVIVSGCCVASSSPTTAVIAATAPTQEGSRIAVQPVSTARASR
jgi:hypothetical protein